MTITQNHGSPIDRLALALSCILRLISQMCSGLSAIEVWCPICGDGMQPRKGGQVGKACVPSVP